MLLFILVNYIRGFVLIKIEGHFIEKFLNICAKRDMHLWEIDKKTSKVLFVKVGIKDFKKMRSIAKKSKSKIKIIKKIGIPFYISRYKKRKFFLLGIVIFVILFNFMTSFIWAIEIKGDQSINKNDIISKLDEIGIRNGTVKYTINPDDISKRILLEIKDLSWVGIQIKGTKLNLEVVKSVKKPEVILKNEPCNIVASHDGIITSLSLKYGEQRVGLGNSITKGQILISGEIISKNPSEPPRYVHAIGEVKARTWYEEEEIVEKQIPYIEKTGRQKKIFKFVFFSNVINLTPGKMNFKEYDVNTKKQKLTFGENTVLPFEINIDTYIENIIKYKEISVEEATKEAYNKALSKAYSKIPTNAVVLNTIYELKKNEDGKTKANVIIECLEDISIEQKIG